MGKRIYLSPPHMGGNESEYVKSAFEQNWIAPVGPHLSQFETKVCDSLGVEHATALSSGTAAIHLSLLLLGIRSGDEILCSTFTFSGSVNPIIYCGATPVFVDSESETWNMSPEFLEAAIIERKKITGSFPKAIVLVHLYGMPAKLAEIMNVASKYEIPIIEDAAEALGSKYDGKSLGSFGELSILSFNGNKIITTSGGGMLLSNNSEFIERAKYLATQARDDAPHYEHSSIGYNYRLSNVCAAIGLGQMEVLDERVKRKQEVHNLYRNGLQSLDGISFLNEPEGYYSNRWLTTVLIDPSMTNGCDNSMVRGELEKHNIESRPLWKPMHMQPIFNSYPFYGDGTSSLLFEKGICLPSGTALSDAEIEDIAQIIRSILLN